MAALQVMGVPDDSPLRNPKQIPYPKPPSPLVQNPIDVKEEGDTPSMRALVVIDSNMELVDLEITSNPDALPYNAPSSNPDTTTQPSGDVQGEHAANIAPNQLNDLTV